MFLSELKVYRFHTKMYFAMDQGQRLELVPFLRNVLVFMYRHLRNLMKGISSGEVSISEESC